MDLCNGVDVYARQWINIGAARWIRQGRNDLIPAFNPGFYLRLDIRLYIVCSFFPPFLSFAAAGTLPRNRPTELYLTVPPLRSPFLQKSGLLLFTRETLLSKLSINHVTLLILPRIKNQKCYYVTASTSF